LLRTELSSGGVYDAKLKPLCERISVHAAALLAMDREEQAKHNGRGQTEQAEHNGRGQTAAVAGADSRRRYPGVRRRAHGRLDDTVDKTRRYAPRDPQRYVRGHWVQRVDGPAATFCAVLTDAVDCSRLFFQRACVCVCVWGCVCGCTRCPDRNRIACCGACVRLRVTVRGSDRATERLAAVTRARQRL
jgi:hypothetical protein